MRHITSCESLVQMHHSHWQQRLVIFANVFRVKTTGKWVWVYSITDKNIDLWYFYQFLQNVHNISRNIVIFVLKVFSYAKQTSPIFSNVLQSYDVVNLNNTNIAVFNSCDNNWCTHTHTIQPNLHLMFVMHKFHMHVNNVRILFYAMENNECGKASTHTNVCFVHFRW